MRRTICSLSTTSVVLLASLASGDASAAFGGPDLFGYTFVDQDDGAVYNYVDITATGMLVATGDTDVDIVPLGAPFEVYGAPLMNIVVNTNGFLTDDLGSANDVSNDCPVPDSPSTGGGFRVYALHDDLVTDVYYQYFDEIAAAAIGYPGETAGISVVQWSGAHDAGGGAVDAEAILFHDDFSIVTMVAADSEGGMGSTVGIQDASASVGLNYSCNTAMSVTPGVTVVQYDLGPAPDSDCCTESPTAGVGCTNTLCQSLICGLDPFCCDTQWDAICAGTAVSECQILCGAPPPITINEIRVDQDGADSDEYFELIGPPGTPLTDVQYIVLGDTPTGEIEAVVDLTGNVIPPSGLFVAAENSFSIGLADFTTTLNFENSDTVTHMLVGGLQAAQSDNLDADADGILDSTPWIVVLDTVSLIDPLSTDLPYGPGSSCMMGPTCQEVNDGIDGPQQVFRCPDGVGTWQIGNTDELAMPSTDTPGVANSCTTCGNGIIEPGEDCDDMGESVMCDSDCTPVMCGDGLINMTAGEVCDDMGESAACDADCTVGHVRRRRHSTRWPAWRTCDEGGRDRHLQRQLHGARHAATASSR